MDNRLADSLFRLSGLVTGMRPYAWLDRLEEMQWWGRQAMLGWQAQQLRMILQHAASTVPYYRRVLPPAVDLADGDVATVLGRLPVLTRDGVRDNYDALRSSARLPRKPLVGSTGGTTGMRLMICVDRAAFARYFAAKFRALRWHGVNFADRQVRVWKHPFQRRERAVCRARDVLQNRLRLTSFDLSADALDHFYDRCLRFAPVYMNGYTSAIWRFGEYVMQSGKDGRELGLKLVVPTCEVLYDWQRQRIEEAFGCPVMNEYGCREVHAVAYECPSACLHITHENVLVEVLDDQGLPVPGGQPGRLTLTSLCNVAMPLIRYQNGDIAVLEPEAHCECGRHPALPVLTCIVGRSSDVLYRADGRPAHYGVIFHAMDGAALPPSMFVEHQARQKSLTLIELTMVRGPTYDDRAMRRFLDRPREMLGEAMRIEVRFVEEIEREESGKLRYFVSDIAQAQVPDGKHS
jgi:phenylacetate-CoA ligase